MIQRRRGAGFPLEPFESLRVFGKAGQEFQGSQTAQFCIPGPIDHTHRAATKSFNNAVAAKSLADEGIVTWRLGGHGKEPLPSSLLTGIVGFQLGEVN